MAKLILEEMIISEFELEKSCQKFYSIDEPSETDKFMMALNLTRSVNQAEIMEGIGMFEMLFIETRDEHLKRDILYFMAIGQTKLSNYKSALNYLQSILNVQPKNIQVRELYNEVNRKMKRDGLIGISIVGSAVLVGLLGVIGIAAATIIASRNK